jgi:outer membrane lipoprotein-sorting protein
MNLFRRLPLYRLLLGLAVAVVVGIGATALAFALGAGPTPPPRQLAQAIHDALGGSKPQGFSANVQLTDNLLEGASLASEGAGGAGGGGGELLSNPLVKGGSGRIWISKEGKFRLELQSEQGDTEIVYDGHTLELYDAATNKLYRYTPEQHSQGGEDNEGQAESGHVPSVAKIREAIDSSKHVHISGASSTDVGGQPAYTVSLSPSEGGSLLSSVQLSFDAENAVPLRAAVYSIASSSPVLELAASEVSFAPVEASVFALEVPSSAKVQDIKSGGHGSSGAVRKRGSGAGKHPKVSLHGKGPGAIAVLEEAASGESSESGALNGLPKVKIGAAKASELRTALGTVLSFERGGVRYLLAGSVKPDALQALASGL